MTVSKKLKRITACGLIAALIMCTVPFKTLAAAGTIYESENNDVRTAADRTYDDYDNFGTISHASDVDWWVFTANYTGFANFWLGSIPSGCNYDLYVYSANGTYMACSAKPSGTQEIVRCRVVSGYTYYAKVISAGGYSGSQYKMRIKNNPIGYARLFTYNCTDINTLPTGTDSIQHIWNMGYDGQWYLNNAAEPVYNTLPSSRIFVIHNHAGPGIIRCDESSSNKTRLYAVANSSMSSSDRAISSYANGALSEVRLAIFAGCNSANTNSDYGNLVDEAINKGVSCAFGWTVTVYDLYANYWITHFFEACTFTDKNVANAAAYADEKLQSYNYDNYTIMKNRYFGSSNNGAIVI